MGRRIKSLATTGFGVALLTATALASCGPTKPAPGASLAWAYPDGPNAIMPQPPPGPQHVPGSAVSFDFSRAGAGQPDWFPDEHPPAPAAVAASRPGKADPCAECHLMNGEGYPGAAGLTGLSAGYIVEQIHEFRSGRRASWQHDRADTEEMIKVARTISDADAEAAAHYFAALKPAAWTRVVEADTVPVTRPNHYGWLDLVPGGGTEPIAGRIVEAPEDTARLFKADPHSGVVDYVPVGSLARGEAVVRNGGCAGCHGAGLRGMGDTPALAGRSGPYLARMLWDIKTGARSGPAVAAMQAPAAGLSEADITDVAAYLASLKRY